MQSIFFPDKIKYMKKSYQNLEQVKKFLKLEKEFFALKQKTEIFTTKIPLSLKGKLKGVVITEEDLYQAKQSLFKVSS